MTKLYATYDGEVLRPEEPLELSPNTRVRIELEPVAAETKETDDYIFLRTARGLDLEGPPDWSARLEDYLYGDAGKDKKPRE